MTGRTSAFPARFARLATFRALRHRNFRLYIFGLAVSLIGTWMQNVAQVWLIYRLTGSEVLLGLTGFSTHLPVLLLGPIAGLAADRFPRQRIVLITQTLFLAQASVLAALTLSGRVHVWHVLALALCAGIINAFDVPARQALIVHLSSREDLLNAVSLNSLIFNAARVLGPSIGGLIVAWLGEGVCFSLNAVSFLAVIGTVLAMHVPDQKPATGAGEGLAAIAQALRFVHRTPEVRRLFAVSAAVNLCMAALFILAPIFADRYFHHGSAGLGFLTGAMGGGAVVGVLLLAASKTAGLDRVIALNTAGLAAALAAFAWSPWWALSIALMPVIGFTLMRQNGATNTSVQMAIPEEFRGRIMGLYSMTVLGMLPIGSLAAGFLAGRFGARPTVFGAALVILAAAISFAANRPRQVPA